MKPNPGSPEAIANGCECPRLDNRNGLGLGDFGNGTCFYINGSCPIHGIKQAGEIKDCPTCRYTYKHTCRAPEFVAMNASEQDALWATSGDCRLWDAYEQTDATSDCCDISKA